MSSYHADWKAIVAQRSSFLHWELKLLRQVLPEHQLKEVKELLLEAPCECGHPRSEHKVIPLDVGWRLGCQHDEPRCHCRTYSWHEPDLTIEQDEEICGESYDHDLETTYEGEDGRQYVCKKCGAEIIEEPE